MRQTPIRIPSQRHHWAMQGLCCELSGQRCDVSFSWPGFKLLIGACNGVRGRGCSKRGHLTAKINLLICTASLNSCVGGILCMQAAKKRARWERRLDVAEPRVVGSRRRDDDVGAWLPCPPGPSSLPKADSPVPVALSVSPRERWTPRRTFTLGSLLGTAHTSICSQLPHWYQLRAASSAYTHIHILSATSSVSLESILSRCRTMPLCTTRCSVPAMLCVQSHRCLLPWPTYLTEHKYRGCTLCSLS
jgi:hypothetical protein